MFEGHDNPADSRVVQYRLAWEDWRNSAFQPDGSETITRMPPQLASSGLAVHELDSASVRLVAKETA